MKLAGRVMAIAVLGVVGMSCGGGDSDGGRSGNGGGSGTAGMGTSGMGGGDPNEVDGAGLCPRVAEILCAAEAACCTTPGRDEAACKDDLEGDCTSTFNAAVIAGNPAVGFDAARAKAALDELESRTDSCATNVAAWSINADGLRAVFTGSLDSGAACDPEGGDNASVAAIGVALFSCKNPASTSCLAAESGWTCAARSAAAGPCFTDLNCQDGLYCEPPDDGIYGGTCGARKGAGMACSTASECVSFVCKDDMCAAENDQQATYCP